MESLLGTTVHGIRLVDRLGQGGMGEVYLGFDERLQRKVAVKAIRRERRLDAVAKARFLREARVLSQLEHPNICRVYDYVEDEDADFLILEYVHGTSLRDPAAGGLRFEGKLAVARQVASALVAAHALSVVHRDLKPENVLVTDAGQAKVLDFGLARTVRGSDLTGEFRRDGTPSPAAERERGAEGTVTELGMVVGTPRYMSPEQARGEPVTAASDVDSFGLLLQELFTGHSSLPRDVEPAVLLQKAMWGETEAVRGTDPHVAELIARLKALSPRDRPSAQAVAERLAWIAGKPQRRVRRAAWGAVAAVLLAAVVVSTAGFVQARRALRRAEASEAAARQAEADTEAVNSFLRTMLTSADPRADGIDIKVVEVLDRAVDGVERDFAGRFTSQATILDTIGGTYYAVGEVRKAADILNRAVEIRRRVQGIDAAETLASEHQLGAVLIETGEYSRAESLLREVVALRWATVGGEHRLTLDTLGTLGRVLQVRRQRAEAEAVLRWGLAVRTVVFGDDDPSTIEAMRSLGIFLRDHRQIAEAERLLCAAYEGARQQLGESHQMTYDALHSLGALYNRAKRFAESEAVMGEVLDALRRTRGPEHPTTLRAANTQGRNLIELGRYAEADALLAATLAIQRRVIGVAHLDTLDTMTSTAYSAHKQGRDADADRIVRQRWDIARRHLGDDHFITLQCRSGYAAGLLNAGRVREAERHYRAILAARRRTLGEDHEATRSTKWSLARVLARTGRIDEALALDPTVPTSSGGPTARR
jgi:serine/threonine protein kinase/tetratricopeptide (TPR) repeat protein